MTFSRPPFRLSYTQNAECGCVLNAFPDCYCIQAFNLCCEGRQKGITHVWQSPNNACLTTLCGFSSCREQNNGPSLYFSDQTLYVGATPSIPNSLNLTFYQFHWTFDESGQRACSASKNAQEKCSSGAFSKSSKQPCYLISFDFLNHQTQPYTI